MPLSLLCLVISATLTRLMALSASCTSFQCRPSPVAMLILRHCFPLRCALSSVHPCLPLLPPRLLSSPLLPLLPLHEWVLEELVKPHAFVRLVAEEAQQ